MPQKIILDCDPGLDDVMAILLAHGNPDIDLLAITTVVGNQTVDKTTRNAQYIAHIAQIKNVVIAAGAPRPLVGPVKNAGDVHGETGLGPISVGEDINEKVPLDPRHAVNVIIDIIMSHESNTVTLVPTGAFTNIALAVRLEPRIVGRVKEVVLMGGGCHKGNRTPVAEFNVFADPEAAHIVFNEPWPLTMVGLDLTHQAMATPPVLDRIGAIGTPLARTVVELMHFYAKAYQLEGPAVHDPCTVAYLIDRSVFSTRRAPIDVELTGALTRGMTVVDLRRPAPAECNTQVAVDLDFDKFWNLIIDALQRIGDPLSSSSTPSS